MCAYVNTTKSPANQDFDSGLNICTVRALDYPTETTFIQFVNRNASYLGKILLYESTSTNYKSYCINANIYYLREKAALCPNVQVTSYCSVNKTTSDISGRDLNSIYSAMTVKCYECQSQEMLFSNSNLTAWPDLGIYIADCIPQITDSTSCQPSQPPQAQITPGCNFNQISIDGRCVECSSLYKDCAVCNSATCLMCIQNHFWMNQSSYVYPTDIDKSKRTSKCTFDTCDVGYCQNIDLKICELNKIGSSCLNCHSTKGVQYCRMCKSGYFISSDQTACTVFPTDTANLIYYVNATTKLIYKNYNQKQTGGPPGTVTPVTETVIDSCSQHAPTQTHDGLTPATGIPLLQMALKTIYSQQKQHYKIKATIYLSKGDHFFFTCTGNELTEFYIKKDVETIFRYCSEYDLARNYYSENDNFEVTILPLECTLGTTLGLTNDASFKSLCVDLKKDGKPVIHVGNAYTYFNVTGSLRVKNIKFSGINALAKLSNQQSAQIDLGVYPQLFCKSVYEPSKHIMIFQPTNISTCFNSLSALNYECIDQLGASLKAAPRSSETCSDQFSSIKTSSLSCSGEIGDRDFFTLSADNLNIYYKRRKTLFNLYSFAEHQSNRNATPELSIEFCDFEYFLASGYESLINIETNSLTSVKVTETLIMADEINQQDSQTFFISNSADRGGKITIDSSTFKHSRFCKGMLVYRPAFYDGKTNSLLNYTDLYMPTYRTLKNNTDAYIIIKNSTFTNLNTFTQVKALAMTGSQQITADLPTGSQLQQALTFPYFVHKGIILNVEDFGGRIEIVGCTFSRNYHYIPGILYKGDSKSLLSIEMFRDTFTTKELQFEVCDISNRKYEYLFGGSSVLTQNADTDLDTFFENYERLGMIYSSRNKAVMIIKDSTFTNNIGTFGGAITINSPDWKSSSQTPQIIIKSNIFQGNMAYFSGNAVYIKTTLLKDGMSETQNCGGVNIIDNTFQNNIGMKVHNGGAISAYCHYVDYIYDQDIQSTSNFTTASLGTTSAISQIMTITSQADSTSIAIQKLKFNIQGNYFSENFSGGRGTALYIRQMSNIRLNTNIFMGNGPVYAVQEHLYSPYLKYFSGRSMTYYDGDCVDELEHLEQCATLTNSGGIQWSKAQGAIHVIFCETDACLNANITQELEISNSEFLKNLAGPVLDSTTLNTASQIFIRGGMKILITECNFFDNRGSMNTFTNMDSSLHALYFPKGSYFQYSMSPLINILMTPPVKMNSESFMNVTVQSCKFYRNRNVQVLGLPSNLIYKASLIEMKNLAASEAAYDQVLNLNIQDCDFKENQFTGSESALIYTSKILTRVVRSTFINNGRITKNQTSKIKQDLESSFPNNITTAFKSYTFNDISDYGCLVIAGDYIFPSGYAHELSNNTFKFNFANQGAALTLLAMDYQSIQLGGNTYEFMFALIEGAVIQWKDTQQKAVLYMEKEKIQFIFSKIYGAIKIKPIQIEAANVFILSSSFSNVYSEYGQAITLFDVGKAYISQVNFTRPSIPQGRNITNYTLSQFTQYTLSLNESFISTELFNELVTGITQQSGYLYLEQVSITDKSNVETTFRGNKVLQSQVSNPYYRYVEILNCNILDNQALAFSGIEIYATQLRVANNYTQNKTTRQVNNPYFIANNSHTQSGVIGSTGKSTIVFENLQFLNNTSVKSASALYMRESTANMTNTSFISNSAGSSGTIIIEANSQATLKACIFKKNWAQNSAAIFAQNNPDTLLSISDSVFIENTAETNLINMLYSNATFKNTLFLDNIATSVNHGITLINSQAYAMNVTINYTNKAFLTQNTYTVDTGFFNLNYQSQITINNSTIQNCRGALAAAIYITGQSQVLITNHTTIRGCYSLEGDVILATLAKSVRVESSVFRENGQQDIYLEQTPGYIKDSKFIKTESTSIKVSSSNITLINNTFEDDTIDFSADEGKALYCNCKGLTTIVNNTFKMLSAVKGGALFLKTSQRSNEQQFFLYGNNFTSNQAQQGGAIFLQDAVLLNLAGSNIFKNNVAIRVNGSNFASKLSPKGMAGALYYSCEIDAIIDGNSELLQKCSVNIAKSNQFLSNSAQDGGALVWTKEKPIVENGTIFKDNKAFYGNDIASYPNNIKLEFISNNDYVNPYNKTTTAADTQSSDILGRLLQDESGEVPPLVSGNTIDFNIYILDQDGNIYKTDSSSKAVLDKDSNSKTSDDVILLNNEAIAKEGVYYFRSVKFISKPGSQTPLKFSISGIESFGNDIGFLKEPLNFTANVRKCVAGEELTADNKCQVCPAGTFQYFLPESKTPCQTCPKDANCFGKATVAPLAGYWRSSNVSSNFIKCPNIDVCLAGDEENPNGKCIEGYQGIVCGDCEPNYSKTKQFSCSKCPDPQRNMIQTIFILLGTVFYISFLVRSTLNSADKQKPVYAVYLKIMTNHFQIIGAISNIDYQWPQQIQNFQDQQSKVSSAGEQVFSFDCFLMGDDGQDEGVPVFFEKLIMYGLLPLIVTGGCLLFWTIVARFKKYSILEFRAKFISTLIVVLFLVHPNIAKAMFLTFNCLDVDGVFRMKENIITVCYQGQHMFFISVVAFPAIGAWIFGIPLFAFIVLLRNRRVLNLMSKKEITAKENDEITQLKMKYGFLFSGYDSRTFFWEVIIMYRKILIIMTSVFLSTVSSESQVLVVIFIIVISMFLQIRFHPYYTHTLNKMENYSLQVAAVTIYTGMYYVTGRHYQYMNNQAVSWFFLICIILPNMIFLLYWGYHMRLEVIKEVYRRNIRSCIFTMIAFQSPQNFYKYHMEKEDAYNEENKQKIIDEPTDDLKKDPQNVEFNLFELNLSKIGIETTPGCEAPINKDLQNEKSSNTLDEFRIDNTQHSTRGQPPKKPTRNTAQQHKSGDTYRQQWEHIPSTSRSFKIHPEGYTPRRDQPLIIEDVALEFPENPDYSTPGEDNERGPDQPQNGFTFNNQKMLNKVAQNLQARSKRNQERFGSQKQDIISSRKERFQEHDNIEELKTSKKSSKPPKSSRYLNEDLEIDEIDIKMCEDFESSDPFKSQKEQTFNKLTVLKPRHKDDSSKSRDKLMRERPYKETDRKESRHNKRVTSSVSPDDVLLVTSRTYDVQINSPITSKRSIKDSRFNESLPLTKKLKNPIISNQTNESQMTFKTPKIEKQSKKDDKREQKSHRHRQPAEKAQPDEPQSLSPPMTTRRSKNETKRDGESRSKSKSPRPTNNNK